MGLWDACNREHPSTAAYLTACGWADEETVGDAAFLSSRAQGDPTSEFLTIRTALIRPTPWHVPGQTLDNPKQPWAI